MKTKLRFMITAAILLSLSLKGISQDVIAESADTPSGQNVSTQNTSTFNDHYALQVFPNPVRDHATISYVVPENGKVIVSIYNIAGQVVKVLADETLARGIYTINWNAVDDGGTRMSRGTYIVKIQTDTDAQAEKISVE